MIDTMHCLITNHSNVRSETRIAGEVGYQGIEFVASKLLRFCGFQAGELATLLRTHNVRAVCINALKDKERSGQDDRSRLIAEAERYCEIASTLGLAVDWVWTASKFPTVFARFQALASRMRRIVLSARQETNRPSDQETNRPSDVITPSGLAPSGIEQAT